MVRIDPQLAFLVALAEAGVPSDIGELLVSGDARRGIAPGALLKALDAVERAKAT